MIAGLIFIVMKKISTTTIFTFFLFLGILPYVYLCFFANPSADDFVFAHLFQTRNYFQLLKGTYLAWSGRFTSNALIYLNPISFNSFFAYKLMALSMLFFQFFSIYFLLRQFFTQLKKQEIVVYSSILLLCYLHNMPTLAEGFYWYTGAVI